MDECENISLKSFWLCNLFVKGKLHLVYSRIYWKLAVGVKILKKKCEIEISNSFLNAFCSISNKELIFERSGEGSYHHLLQEKNKNRFKFWDDIGVNKASTNCIHFGTYSQSLYVHIFKVKNYQVIVSSYFCFQKKILFGKSYIDLFGFHKLV